MVTELVERLERNRFSGHTLTLKIKFHDFSQLTRSTTQKQTFHTLDEILPSAKSLLKEIDYSTHPIRLIGLSVSNPKAEELPLHNGWKQLELDFEDLDK